ncbi:MAG: hypothetical protein WCJ09_22685 [Planctomycetota bacterium]
MTDSLNTIETPLSQRTEYRNGGVLSASALAGDSSVSVAAWEMHQKVAHIGGIVAGLFVKKKTGKLIVRPGAAIDSQGRMLLLGNETPPDTPPKVTNYKVYLRYSSEEIAGSGSALGRYLESPRVEWITLDDSVDPCEVPSDGVVLAVVRGDQIETCCRRYVGAVGSRIDAPSGRASVVLGPQFPSDTRRFAIAVKPDSSQPLGDVLSWESTGTISFKSKSSIESFKSQSTIKSQSEKQIVPKPPVMVVGVPTVQITSEDIVDPCAVWEFLRCKNDDGTVSRDPAVPCSILNLLSPCDQFMLKSPPKCLQQLTNLLVRTLNRILRNTADLCVNPEGYLPSVGRRVINSQGQFCVVSAIDPLTLSCDLAGGGKASWYDLLPDWSWSVQLLDMAKHRRQRIQNRLPLFWRPLPAQYLYRLLLDVLLDGALLPVQVPRPRGVYFNGSRTVDPEPSASRIHLVEYKNDGQTFKQLRITIPDPGKDNNPHRYRCSIGTAPDCTHPAAPSPQGDIWNRQTSWPRGILSVLADGSVDIHDQLNVNANGIVPGLVVKLKPTGAIAGGVRGATANSSISTPILANVVVWKGTKVERRRTANPPPESKLVFSGELHNLADIDVDSVQILVSIYGKGDTTHTPRHTEIISNKTLRAASSETISNLAQPPGEVKLIVPNEFANAEIIVSLLVMGVNRNNAIICTQYQETLQVH